MAQSVLIPILIRPLVKRHNAITMTWSHSTLNNVSYMGSIKILNNLPASKLSVQSIIDRFNTSRVFIE